ncbi:MAG TPA: hypothetical protein VIT18_04665, partial [Terrimicrobiaceae bacterium]
MLTFPEVFTHKSVVVFPDDEDPNIFYLLAGRPRLRLDDNNRPVFRGLFWTDDASGSQPSVAGLRGALLHFDVNLEVPQTLRDEILERIKTTAVQQQRVEQMERDEKERIQRMARATGGGTGGLPQPRIPEIREPRFGSIQFLGGKVELLEEKDGQFVQWSSAGGPPSLIGDNNSAFALRLGAEGAAVWSRGLEQDATAIGVRYELKFQARLPSLQIHVWAGSHQKLEVERKAERVIQNMDQGCSDADVERIDVKEVSETLTEEGLVNVEIIKGSAKISDEQVSQLRNAAIGLISDRVKEILMHKIRGMTEEERRTSLVQKVTEEVTAFAELRLTQRDVIEWSANPQATITEFLGGITGDARKKLITLVDLSDPVVSTLEADVSANAAWDDGQSGVTRVIVKVEYPAAQDDPKAVQEFAFDKNSPSAQKFRCRRVRRDRGTLNYSAIAFVKGSAQPILLPRSQTNGHVHVEVPNLGSIKMKLRPNPSMFNTGGSGKITAVQVNYEYKDAAAPDHVADTAVVRPSDLDSGVSVSHQTFREIDQPVRFKPVYLREGAPAITGVEQQTWIQAGRESTLEIPLPWTDFLQVSTRVLGVDGLKRAQVDLRYDDGSFKSDAQIALDKDSADEAGAAWSGKTSLPQIDKSKQRFRYRYSVEGAGQLVVGPWVDAEGDQELILPVLAVKLRTDRLNLGTNVTEALVRLKYLDTSRQFETRHEFFLNKDKASDIWLVPRVDP